MITTESLVRWAHPERGLVLPAEFIPIAEDTRMIVELGDWVLNHACLQARRWADEMALAGKPGPGVSVNLSAVQIGEPDLVDRVRAALGASGLSPEELTLEITESLVMADAESAVEVLRRLKALGARLSIDDFGTGYSSLSYLKRFPVDELKIDGSFVAGLGSDPDDDVIVAAIIRLAGALGIQTVGEGVETAQQAEELRRLGCGRAQGYYFGAAEPADVMTARLRSSRRRRRSRNARRRDRCRRSAPRCHQGRWLGTWLSVAGCVPASGTGRCPECRWPAVPWRRRRHLSPNRNRWCRRRCCARLAWRRMGRCS